MDLEEIQEKILALVDGNGGNVTVRYVVEALDPTYPPRQVRRSLRVLLEAGSLQYGDSLELKRVNEPGALNS